MKDTYCLHGGIRRRIFVLAALSLPLMTSTGVRGAAQAPSPSSPATGAPGGRADAVQRDIEKREYEVTWQERPRVNGLPAAWQAPNRAHGFRTYFTDDGPRLIPRQEESPAWQWGLRLQSVGRGDTPLPAAPAVLTPRANRLTYDRGSVVEWYVNDQRGLEQGMTLSSPPEADEAWAAAPVEGVSGEQNGAPRNTPLAVVFAVEGDLSPLLSADGQTIDFVTPTGAPALRYAGLVVTDAAGRLLPARMQGWNDAGARGIRLLIDDAGAVWPLTIDPLLTSPAWTAEGDQADAQFGVSVGTAGDVNGDGYSDVIVGAYLFDNGQTDEGRAFVYHGSAAGLSLTADWTAEGNQTGGIFGQSVGTAGDVNGDGYADLIVGASRFDNGQTDEGRAYVYHGSPTGLAPVPAWIAESDQAYAEFGTSVVTAGDVNGDGYADVIVGTPYFDNQVTDEGRVYLHQGSATGLAPTPSWMDEGHSENAFFGFSVATAGDVNGDGFSDVIAAVNGFGYAQVYHGSASGLSHQPVWNASYAGVSVGTAGDVNGDGYADVIVADSRISLGQDHEGAAYVYLGGAGSGLSQTPSFVAEGNQDYALFGISLGTAGDVNGDGYSDIIVGAAQFDNGEVDEGRAYLYYGSASGMVPTPGWTAESNQSAAQFGWSVATAGDVNGDGYSDVIVGAPFFDNPQTDEGRAFLYYGNGGTGLSLRAQQRRRDDVAPIAPLGASDSHDAFRLAATGRSPFGRGLVKLELEVKPSGIPLDGTGIQTSQAWTDTGTAGAALNEVVSVLPGDMYHWLLRVWHHPATSPFQTHGRWITHAWNGLQEGDLQAPALADLAVTQVEGDDPVLFGAADLTFTVSVANQGPDDVAVRLLDTLPAGAVFVGAGPSQGTCAPPVAGVLTCDLGRVQAGGSASVVATVTPQAAGSYTNTAVAALVFAGSDPAPSNNTSSETTTVLSPSIGDRVWVDMNENGIQDSGEPGLEDVLVTLHDGGGVLLAGIITDASGAYLFTGVTLGGAYRIRILTPTGYHLAPRDQGTDDRLDSDVNPATQLSQVFVLSSAQDPFRWDAGLVPDVPLCLAPDEPVFISDVTLSNDGNSYPILHYQDPNQTGQVTGYNVRRSSDPGISPASWPLVATDVIDMDEAMPNKQWVDTSGAVSPSGIWYYNVTAFNSRCPAEGPL